MAKRNIRLKTDEILRKKCKKVNDITPSVWQLLDDMAETMYAANGVGLAAPQVTYLMHALKEKGFAVDENATTIEEAKASILTVFGK